MATATTLTAKTTHTGPVFVTLAYAWGYIAGAQRKGYTRAALVAASLLR